jgi:predicted nucleotidyltransferase
LSVTWTARLVFLFGSSADEERTEVRDIDLAVLSQPPLALDELMRLRADAVAAAGGLPVDLVSLNDASIVLAHEVADTGRCLYARSPDAETDFVVRARARYWDFKPFLDEQWRLTGERLAERSRRGSPS